MTEEHIHTKRSALRIWIALAVVLLLLVLALLPPFLNINRYRHRIAASIGGSLGRPVFIDNVGFRILPTPAFTIENFVVGENPAFGSEPFMRANTVTATLHPSSLWRGQLEFATISLEEPSVNIVRNASGQWNIEGILLQAAQIHTAPTEQRRAGSVPRFPYIEATQARVNLKMGNEKMPFSLTDAKLALWLSQPEMWHVRMEARPLRTDMNATDTGLVQLEGTFQRAATLDAIPLALTAGWRKAQLGDVSHMLIGQNAGWRGTLDAEATVTGHFGNAQVDTKLHLDELRRADFEPEHALALDLACSANALGNLHSLDTLHCTLPLGTGSIAVEGNIADLRDKPKPSLRFTAQQIPASQLLELARHTTDRLAPALTADGTLDGTFAYNTATPATKTKKPLPVQTWQSSLTMPTLVLQVPGINDPLKITNLHLHTADATTKRHNALTGAVLDPISLALGGPAPAALDGILHHDNYMLHLRGSVNEAQILALAQAVPQFGDGLKSVLPNSVAAAPVYIDATTQRTWSGLGIYAGASALPQASEHWTAAKSARLRKH